MMFLSFPQFIVRIDQSAEKGAVKEKPVFLIILPFSSLCINNPSELCKALKG